MLQYHHKNNIYNDVQKNLHFCIFYWKLSVSKQKKKLSVLNASTFLFAGNQL
eukprot:TRINITY_DN1505_c0_g1_i1.p1 TRINITY_DN1505_c0_g1~~TRINITY_DN1505_c0_g1_i1.p1  ORF type:complete len:52 (+),score=1.81 TRINITY_DN1505_c0_g1_i1:67-222(+)